jgi:hypothetical protein
MDYARELIAAQSHRRMIDPRFLAKRVTPFEIVRVPAASAHPEQAQRANVVEADGRQDIAR